MTLSLCGVALAGIDAAWIAVAFLGIALARGLHEPVLAGYVNRRIESRRRATVLSVQSVAGNVAMAIVWPLAGVVADAFGAAGGVPGCTRRARWLLGGGALLLWSRAEGEEARDGLTSARRRG